MIYKTFVRPLLFLKDPEKAHEQTLSLLSRLANIEPVLEWAFASSQDDRLQVNLGPLTFPNPVGLAAGFDKNGHALAVWPGFGFGFVEMGAVTARPQAGNPRPRLFRLPKDRALINRLGFNNEGAEAIARRLEFLRQGGRWPKIPVGINIGRSRDVGPGETVADYLFTFELLFSHADYFTLNVSSPNTPGLREIQEKSRLADLLSAVRSRNRELARRHGCEEKPLMVKIAPDIDFDELDGIVEVLQAHEVTAVIATNTTVFLRETLHTRVDEPGGLSGKPLGSEATRFIRHIYHSTRGSLPVVGSGGVFTAEDAYEKITAGARALQIYTGFVYEGPSAVKRINRGLLRLIHRDGFVTVAAAVGSQAFRSP